MFFTLHILFMAIAAMGVTAGVGTAVFFRKKKNWLKIHKFLNLLSIYVITAGFIMAFAYISGTGGKHFDGTHQITGFTAFSFSFITVFMGFYQFKAKNKPAARTVHRWLGRLSLSGLLATIIMGLKLINII